MNTVREGVPPQMEEIGPATAQPRHILHVFPSFQMGGVPIRITSIVNRLGTRFRHTIVAMDGDFSCQSRLDPQLDLTYIPVSLSGANLLRTIAEIRRILNDTAPDLLLTYNWGSIEWPLANLLFPVCPHIHFESGFGVEEADGLMRRRALARRVALSRTMKVVVPSRTLVQIATRTWGLSSGKVLYIPNGVDYEKFFIAPMQGIIPGFIKASGELIVGTVAPLRREKNLGRLLRAFAAVRGEFKVRLLIAGDGPERAELARLADSLGITDVVVFAGHVDRVEGVLGWFDVFAMSSDTEQMPNSLLQAMAAGLPVVATDVGDIKHILPSHNAALVVPKNDELSFASALRRLLAEPALRNKSGQRNREQVRAHYGFDQMVEAYRSLLEDACAATHAERPRDHALGRAVIK